MTIRNKDSYVNALWDWGFLDDCFGGKKIRVTDVDGLVERNCHFLMIEAKGPGKEIPQGQQILFSNLRKTFDDRFHILVIWGNPNQPEEYQLWGYGKRIGGTQEIKDLVRRWYLFADGDKKKGG